jgi:hypothetical protein
MKLSSLINSKALYTPEGNPVWLWHSIRKCDLPCVLADGLIWRPYVWLSSTRKAAIGFHPGKDRVIVRVNTAGLDAALLHRDTSWRQWVGSLKRSATALPPPALVEYWARLRRYEDPESAKRLHAAATGQPNDPQRIRQDLRTQIARVRPDQLWWYESFVPPHCLSVANDAGFYQSLKLDTREAEDADEDEEASQKDPG